MRDVIRIHYDNQNDFSEPILWVWVTDGATLEKEAAPVGKDDFGYIFDLSTIEQFSFLF